MTKAICAIPAIDTLSRTLHARATMARADMVRSDVLQSDVAHQTWRLMNPGALDAPDARVVAILPYRDRDTRPRRPADGRRVPDNWG
jgi:hypothetical protein